MGQEFEGDLQDAEFWGADLRGALFRDVNFTGARITHAWLVDMEVDAFVDGLVINGVDVTAFVNENDRWYPLRSVLNVTDPQSMREAWVALREAWTAMIERARRLPDETLHRSVDSEWSLVQTLRHLVMATDKWFAAPVLGDRFHSLGMPNTGSVDFPFPGIDRDADPTLEEVLAAREDQAAHLGDYLATITDDDLTRTVDVLENGPQPIQACISTVFEEEFWHLRYADRDLTVIESEA